MNKWKRPPLETAEYDPKKYMSLKSVAKMLEYSPSYVWYTLSAAYQMKRFTNGKTQFFLIDEVRNVKQRLQNDRTTANGHIAPGIMQRLLKPVRGTKRKSSTRRNTDSVKMDTIRSTGSDNGVPVVEINLDQMAYLVKKGAIKVKMK